MESAAGHGDRDLMINVLRIGNDVCLAIDVEESMANFGEQYLERVFTDGEREYAASAPLMESERLAARFAAKEAVLKVLRPIGARPEWRSIEVVRDPQGWCEVVLTGSAAELAQQQNITEIAVSLSHDHGTAIAVAVAQVGATTKPEPKGTA